MKKSKVNEGQLPRPDLNAMTAVGQHRSITSSASLKWQKYSDGILYMVNAGLIGLKTLHESLILSNAMILYLPPNTEYLECFMGLAMSSWIIHLPTESITNLPDKPKVYAPKRLLKEIALEIVSWGKTTEQNKVIMQQRLMDVFIDQLSILPEGNYFPISLPATTSLLNVAISIIKSPDDKKSLGYWSKISGMSRSSFTGHWKKETGLSFAIWRQRVKMQAALKLLAEGKTVSETANELGFTSASVFGEVFSKQFGMSPKKFMKEKSHELSSYIQDNLFVSKKK